MSFLVALAALVFLMFVAYRGFSVILFAPVAALGAVLLTDPGAVPAAFTSLFMDKMVGFAKLYFPVFLLGAVFGKVIELSGFSKSIVAAVIGLVGSQRAMLAIVLVCAVLTYGGVSLFVVVFAAYPFAAEMFRAGNIPKRLIPGTIALGAFSFTMDSLPFSPQIQNIIPTTYFKTTNGAAPILGSIGAIFIFVLGMTYLEWRRRQAAAAGEGYGEGHSNEPPPVDTTHLAPAFIAFLPLIVVFLINLLLGGFPGVFNGLIDRAYGANYDLTLALDHAIATPIPGIKAIWAVEGALVAGILTVFVFADAGQRRAVMDRAAGGDEHRVRIWLWWRDRSLARVSRDQGCAEGHPQPAGQRSNHRHLAGRHHRLRLGRHVDRACGHGQGLCRHGGGGAYSPRSPAPGGVDGERRHGYAAAQWRGDHAAGGNGVDPPAVVQGHLRRDVPEDARGVLRDRRLLCHGAGIAAGGAGS